MFAYEWLLRLLNGLGAWLTASHWRSTGGVSLSGASPRQGLRTDFCTPAASSTPSGYFPAELLAAPLRDGSHTPRFLTEAPASITTLYRRDRAVILVRDAIRAALPEQPSLNDVARALFLARSCTGGWRRGQLSGRIRMASAGACRRWLTKSQRPLSAIASDLGFADALGLLPRLPQLDGKAPPISTARPTHPPKPHACWGDSPRSPWPATLKLKKGGFQNKLKSNAAGSRTPVPLQGGLPRARDFPSGR